MLLPFWPGCTGEVETYLLVLNAIGRNHKNNSWHKPSIYKSEWYVQRSQAKAGNQDQQNHPLKICLLSVVINDCKKHGNTDKQLMKYYTLPNFAEKLSIHYLTTTSQTKTPHEYNQHCKLQMSKNVCEEAE